MHLFSLQRWIKISLLNLLIVSVIGVILRYKIAFSFPWVDQKHLLHGHSHFAFAAWLSQVLMALMVAQLPKRGIQIQERKYNLLLTVNLASSYGMLISFPLQGYGLYSIFFSTLSIFTSYYFAIVYWRDINAATAKNPSGKWFKAALVFNAVSSAGAFALAVMMATKTIHQNWYLAAIYFFLHFQYNGWFFFACMGLLVDSLNDVIPNVVKLKKVFIAFLLSCIPAYLLSTLWMEVPLIVYLIVIMAALVQVFAWVWLISFITGNYHLLKQNLPAVARWVIGFSFLAFSIKFLLQLGSVIPVLSTLAFGFRPIVIGYLHLVLLGCISLFIIGYLSAHGFISTGKIATRAVLMFVSGIILNELLLLVQGVCAIKYIPIPYINESLFGVAVLMFSALLLLNIAQYRKKY